MVSAKWLPHQKVFMIYMFWWTLFPLLSPIVMPTLSMLAWQSDVTVWCHREGHVSWIHMTFSMCIWYRKILGETTRTVLTNGFSKVIASSENIYDIHLLMNIISIVISSCHANIVNVFITVWCHSMMSQGGTCPLICIHGGTECFVLTKWT